MSWIAKNSITDKTYGKSFDSIYDCQNFIDKELCFLEYEMQRCFALEKDVEYRLANSHLSFWDSVFKVVEDSVNSCAESVRSYFELSLYAKDQKKCDKILHDMAVVNWQKNNVIRCWYIEQERFADGFDF